MNCQNSSLTVLLTFYRKRVTELAQKTIMDAVIMKQAENRKRNFSMTYIDYRKAFDSVSHDWLLKVLELYKVIGKVVKLLSCIIKNLQTQIQLNNSTLATISILNGLFQGASFSPL